MLAMSPPMYASSHRLLLGPATPSALTPPGISPRRTTPAPAPRPNPTPVPVVVESCNVSRIEALLEELRRAERPAAPLPPPSLPPTPPTVLVTAPAPPAIDQALLARIQESIAQVKAQQHDNLATLLQLLQGWDGTLWPLQMSFASPLFIRCSAAPRQMLTAGMWSSAEKQASSLTPMLQKLFALEAKVTDLTASQLPDLHKVCRQAAPPPAGYTHTHRPYAVTSLHTVHPTAVADWPYGNLVGSSASGRARGTGASPSGNHTGDLQP